MKSLPKLHKELSFNREMSELVDTLKGVAIAEFQALERNKERFNHFLESVGSFFKLIDFSQVEHPFTEGSGQLGIIMVTSDEGFMGGLNTRVMEEALNHPRAAEAELIVIGSRGENYLKGMGYEEIISFPGIGSDQRYEAALKLKEYVIRRSLQGEVGRFIIFYPKPVSFFVQRVERVDILPCHELFEGSPKKEESLVDRQKRNDWISFIPGVDEEIVVESSLEKMVEYLAETWMMQKLFEIFEESKLAELAARAGHLEESHQNLIDEGKNVRFQYFQSHHEMIDSELRDMFSAQVVRKKKKRIET